MNAGLITVIIVFVVFAGVFVPLFLWAKRRSQAVRAANRQIEESFGLTNQSPHSKGAYPNLRGTIDGIEVVVDIYQQRYRSSKKTAGTRPWTRVRAQLSAEQPFQLRKRHQRYADKIDLPTRETGNTAFDEKYELFMPAEVSVAETLPPALMDALIAADPSVDILNKVVVWMQKGLVDNHQLLKNAVRTCVNVASAIEETAV